MTPYLSQLLQDDIGAALVLDAEDRVVWANGACLLLMPNLRTLVKSISLQGGKPSPASEETACSDPLAGVSLRNLIPDAPPLETGSVSNLSASGPVQYMLQAPHQCQSPFTTAAQVRCTRALIRGGDGAVEGSILRCTTQPNTSFEDLALPAFLAILADGSASLRTRIRNALGLGCQLLSMSSGILSHIDADTYTTAHAYCAEGIIKPGLRFESPWNICREVIAQGRTLTLSSAPRHPSQYHPCYQVLQLQSYIGAPVFFGPHAFGTLAFSSNEQRAAFSQPEIATVTTMARLLSVLLMSAPVPTQRRSAAPVVVQSPPMPHPAQQPPQSLQQAAPPEATMARLSQAMRLRPKERSAAQS